MGLKGGLPARRARKRLRAAWNRFAGGLRRLAEAVTRRIADLCKRYGRRASFTFVAGAAIALLMRAPIVNQSIVGDLDRQTLKVAFLLRSGAFVGPGDPILLLDIDNSSVRPSAAGSKGREPPPAVSRRTLATLLRYVLRAPHNRLPKVVVLDVDLASASAADDPGVSELHDVLAQWASRPDMPRLVIAREAFPANVLGLDGDAVTLPVSDYDDVVARAPNISWGGSRMLVDREGVVREILPYQCVRNGGRTTALISIALEAYLAMQGPGEQRSGNAGRWVAEAARKCAADPRHAIAHGETINYHLPMSREDIDHERAWPSLPRRWPGFKICGADADSSIFRRVSAADIPQDALEAASDPLCQRIVIIGGTNDIGADFHQTPLYDMAGPMVVGNAIRGLQLSDGGLRPLPVAIQLALVAAASLTITLGFSLSRQLRRRYRRQRRSVNQLRDIVLLLPLNPVILNWIVAIIAHYVGVAALLLTLNLGYWCVLSGPAFASAMAEAVQDFTEEDE